MCTKSKYLIEGEIEYQVLEMSRSLSMNSSSTVLHVPELKLAENILQTIMILHLR